MNDDLVLSIRFTGDGKGLVEAVDGSSDQLKKFASNADKADKSSRKAAKGQDDLADSGKRASNTGQRLNRVYNNLGRTILTTAGAYIGLRAIQEDISAFESQEQAVAALDQSIVSMHRNTLGLSEQLQALASEIQRDGIIGDEALIKGQSFLTTYSDITDDLLPRATRVMADLAAKMGGDVVSAANTVGKAGMGMVGELSRIGITLSDTAKESKDFKIILGEIESQVGGMNSALAATSTGGIKQFANAWGDSKERMGEAIAFAAGPLLRELSTELEISQADAERWGQAIFDMMESVATGTAGLVDTMEAPIGTIKNLAGDIWEGYTKLPTWAQEIGVVGALLGGKKGVLLLGALAKFTADSKATAEWWSAYSSGKVGFVEWFTSGQEEAKRRLQELHDQGILVTEDLPSIPDTLFPKDGSGNAEQAITAFFARVRTAMEDAQLDREAERIFREMDRFNAEFDTSTEGAKNLGSAATNMGDEWDKAFDLIIQQFDDLDDAEARNIAGLDKVKNTGKDAFAELTAATKGWGDEFTNTLADMVQQGKLDFKSLTDSIIKDLLRIYIYQNVTKPVFGALNLPGFGSTTTAGVHHTGGIAGQASSSRAVSSAYFAANAPRYHTGGIAGDEVPAILKRGEEVLPANDPRHIKNQGKAQGGDVRVELVNRSGTPLKAGSASAKFDAKGMMLTVMLDDLDTDGPFAHKLRATHNVQRTA